MLDIKIIISSMIVVSCLVGCSSVTQQEKNEIKDDEKVSSIKLYTYDCGHIEARDMSVFGGTTKEGVHKELANTCYLIKHPKGTLFWDAGISDELISLPDGEDRFYGKFNMKVKKTLKSQFQESNINPNDIDYLVFSHLHNDHTGNAKLFKNSQWIIQKSEYDIAFSPMAKKYGYRPIDYKFDGFQNIKKINGDYDVFGDGSIVLISTPGHSPGHQSLLVKLPKTGTILISGDCFITHEHRQNYGIPTWGDKKNSIHSFVKIDEILETYNATLWIPHDKELFESQKHTPLFYE